MAIGITSNFGHCSLSRKSKIFGYGRRLRPMVQHYKQSFLRLLLSPNLGRCMDYGRPMKPFIIGIPNFGLGRQIGQINFGVGRIWGIFGLNNQHPFWYYEFSIIQPLFLQKLSLYVLIPNIFWGLGLGLGFEFGSQRIRNLAFVCP